MRVLLVALDSAASRLVERGAKLAGAVRITAVSEDDAISAAIAGEPPAAAVLSDAAAEPIRLAQSLAAIDRETSITILCAPERQDELRQSLLFTPLITRETRCRSSDDLEQLGVDLVEAAQAAIRRREHHASIAAASARLATETEIPRLRREALGRLVEAAPIGILTVNSAHAVAGWNAYAAEIIGAREPEVVGRPVDDLFEPAERDRLAMLLQHPAPPDPQGPPLLFRRLRRGVEQFVEVLAGPTLAQDGQRGTLLVLSDVTGRIRAERAQRRAEQAQTFLAETGALLDASLDPVQTLQRIASLAVPARAELCVIDMLTEDETIAGVAFAAIDPEVAQAVKDIRQRYPVDPRGAHPVARVLRTGSAEVLEEMTDATYRRVAQSEEHLALMRRLHYHSALVAPLTARGRRYGVISLLYLDPARRYSPDDLQILQDVARRAALALDNARLYAREHQIAETLQRSLLPWRLPDVPGVTLAAHYEPGDGDVGGDWYDVIPLPDGRLGCVVGDIVGRGINAAAAMGQLRNAVRVYALERQSADDVVSAVDGLSQSLEIGTMATLTYLILDRAHDSIEICSAGHPPPLVIAPDGSTSYLMSGRSPPVGIGHAHAHVAATEPFPAGSLLLIYTDGLIERRGSTIDEGLARLEAATTAAAPGRDPAAIARDVLSALRPQAKTDDVALLVIRADAVGEAGSTRKPHPRNT